MGQDQARRMGKIRILRGGWEDPTHSVDYGLPSECKCKATPEKNSLGLSLWALQDLSMAGEWRNPSAGRLLCCSVFQIFWKPGKQNGEREEIHTMGMLRAAAVSNKKLLWYKWCRTHSLGTRKDFRKTFCRFYVLRDCVCVCMHMSMCLHVYLGTQVDFFSCLMEQVM